MISIRRYLARALMWVLAIATLLAVTAAYLITDHELEEILDTQLSLHTRVVAGQIEADMPREAYARLAHRLDTPDHQARWYEDGEVQLDESGETPAPLYHEEERKLTLGFWNADGSPRLLGAEWNDSGPFPAPREEGFRWEIYDSQEWRVFSLYDVASRTWISMGLRHEFQSEIVERIALNNLIPLLIMLPLLLWLMGRIIRRGLAPISLLSDQVQGRGAQDLRRIETAVPREIEGLRDSLNDFIERLGETLER
ncbi:sensor histidine kinase, partial [Halomonas sp. BBD48]|nr:sensor histidine kinase [Halomonas sp. BBD48]